MMHYLWFRERCAFYLNSSTFQCWQDSHELITRFDRKPHSFFFISFVLHFSFSCSQFRFPLSFVATNNMNASFFVSLFMTPLTRLRNRSIFIIRFNYSDSIDSFVGIRALQPHIVQLSVFIEFDYTCKRFLHSLRFVRFQNSKFCYCSLMLSTGLS